MVRLKTSPLIISPLRGLLHLLTHFCYNRNIPSGLKNEKQSRRDANIIDNENINNQPIPKGGQYYRYN